MTSTVCPLDQATPNTGQQSTPQIIGVDFFCGAGGATRGFLDAGIDIVCGIDNDESAKDTYQKNNPRPCGCPSKFLSLDVSADITEALSAQIGDQRGKALVFIGCSPCQPFTNLKTEKTHQGDSKHLLLSFLDQIRAFLPEYVVMENVPGIAAGKFEGAFHKFVKGLRDEKYRVDYGPLDAKKFGVPQTRRRMILVASLLGEIKLPAETHGPDKSPYVTVAEAIKKYPRIVSGEAHRDVPNHQAARLTEINKKRLAIARAKWPDELQLDCYRDHDGHTDVYCRMSYDKPSPALTTRFNSISNGRFGHPRQLRGISIREGAALQTFPDDYVFHAAFTRNAKHIGNAVPVLLARVLAETIVKHYNDYACGVRKSVDARQTALLPGDPDHARIQDQS